MDALRRLVRALSTAAREQSTSAGPRSALSGAQLFVMRTIAARPGLSIGQLAEATLARQSTVSEVVGRLVERGLVAREVGALDARQTELTLTKAGIRSIARSAQTVQERLAGALAALPRARRVALAGTLETLLENAGLADVPARMFFEEQDAARTSRARKSGTRRRAT